MDVFVNGGVGDIGSACTQKLLNSGHQVAGFDSLTEGTDQLRQRKVIGFVKGFFKQGAILFVMLTLAGCASSGVIKNATPVATSVPVSVDFALIQTSTALAGLATETHLLNDLVVSNLRGRGVFGDVEDNPAATGSSGGIKVEIKILEIKKISNDEREWAGALAGRAHILVQATVSDLISGKPIETFQAEGQSSGGSNLAGTTNEAVQRAAEQVVAEVVRISRLTGP